MIPNPIQKKIKIEKGIQTDNTSADRDANGQQFGGGQQQPEHGPMSEEQLSAALEHLKNLPVVKEKNLKVELKFIDQRKFVFITDNLGKVIRRIPEAELWTLNTTKESSKSQLLSKIA